MLHSTGQNTGRAAQMVATSTSRAARTMGVDPYQVGSKPGYVVARVFIIDARRHIEKMLALKALLKNESREEALSALGGREHERSALWKRPLTCCRS